MLRAILPAAVICLLLAACTDKDGNQSGAPPDATPLIETDRAFAKMSSDSGAVSAFTTYLAEDAIQMPTGTGPIEGRDNIVASMASGPEVTLLWEPKHAEIASSGELGWTWGIYEARFSNEKGEQMSSSGKYVNVWRRQSDGSWRVVVDMGNTGV